MLLSLLASTALAGSLVSSTPDWSYTGAKSSYLGYTVAGGLDIDRDQNLEIAVASPYVTPRIDVFEAMGGVLPSTPTWTIASPSGTSEFGWALADVGDVDGDGWHDLAVGAPFAASEAGEVYVYRGSSSGPASSPDYTLTGSYGGYYEGVGASIAALGDVDGDGYDDFATGAPYRGTGGWTYGGFDLWLGSAAGPVLAVSTVGTSKNGQIGWAMAAGDFDGDGHADLAVGAAGVDDHGVVYVYEGTSTGLDTTPLVHLDGANLSEEYGDALAAGDFDGDGYDDLAIGAWAYDGESGRVDVFGGGPSGLDPSTLMAANAPVGGGAYGAKLALLGDTNGDGYPELGVGEPRVHRGAGVVHVVPGSSSGPNFGAEAARTLGKADDGFGYALAGAGDLNRDGLDDVVAATPEAGAGTAGIVVVYDGTAAVTVDTGDSGDTGTTDTDTDTGGGHTDSGAIHDTGGADTGEADETDDGDSDGPGDTGGPSKATCGCSTGGTAAMPLWLGAAMLIARRRRALR